MALPGNVTTVTITGTFQDASGTALTGTVTFTPTIAVRDADAGTIIARDPVEATLDASGSLTVDLAAVDDPQLDPTGFAYTVIEQVAAYGRRYRIQPVEADAPSRDLASMAPVSTVAPAFADVSSVNGQSGAVILNASDVGARPSERTAPTYTVDPAVADGASDNTAAIQAQLDNAAAAGGGVVRIPKGVSGAYLILSPLTVSSNTVIDARGARIELADSTSPFGSRSTQMLRNHAHTLARIAHDGATTAGSATLTATAGFTADDVGQLIRVEGAGVGGDDLETTIASVTDSATVDLTDVPQTTVSGAWVVSGPRDRDITLVGGVWDRGDNSGGQDLGAHSIAAHRVDRLHISDIDFRSAGGKFAFYLVDLTAFAVERVHFDAYSDGTNMGGHCHGGVIRDLYGSCGDDVVPMLGELTLDPQYTLPGGGISDILVENVNVASPTGLGGIGTEGHRFDNITYRNMHYQGEGQASIFVAAWQGPNSGGRDADPRKLGTVRFENLHGSIDASSTGVAEAVTVSGLRAPLDTRGVRIQGLDVEYLSVAGISNPAETTADDAKTVEIRGGSHVTSLVLQNAHWHAMTDLIAIDGNSTVDDVVVANMSVVNTTTSGKVVHVGSGSTVPRVKMTNCAFDLWGIIGTATTTVASLVNVQNVHNGGLVFTGGDLTIRGAAIQYGGDFYVETDAVLRCEALDFPVDLTLLTPTANDLATNTNSALACGTGPVGFDGTAWVHLVTGATYTPA